MEGGQPPGSGRRGIPGFPGGVSGGRNVRPEGSSIKPGLMDGKPRAVISLTRAPNYPVVFL